MSLASREIQPGIRRGPAAPTVKDTVGVRVCSAKELTLSQIKKAEEYAGVLGSIIAEEGPSGSMSYIQPGCESKLPTTGHVVLLARNSHIEAKNTKKDPGKFAVR